MMGILSPRLVLLSMILLGVVACFAFGLTRELSASRQLPEGPGRQAPSVSPAGTADVKSVGVSAQRDERALYSAIAVKSHFSPTPSATAATAGGPGTIQEAAKPFLHGVVINDTKSRAYLEDPASKKIFGYAVGDSVGGGRLEAIKADRVVIVRPEGPVEVWLRDASRPQPAATVTADATETAIQPSLPGRRPTPSTGPSPAPPLPLQSIPPNFLRRAPVLSQPEEPH
jgi:hypothetical protein